MSWEVVTEEILITKCIDVVQFCFTPQIQETDVGNENAHKCVEVSQNWKTSPLPFSLGDGNIYLEKQIGKEIC